MTLRAQGYATMVEPDRATVERDTFTCFHGNEVVFVRPGQVNQAPMCMQCMQRICLKCAGEAHRTMRCTPFEKKVEEYERGQRRSI